MAAAAARDAPTSLAARRALVSGVRRARPWLAPTAIIHTIQDIGSARAPPARRGSARPRLANVERTSVDAIAIHVIVALAAQADARAPSSVRQRPRSGAVKMRPHAIRPQRIIVPIGNAAANRDNQPQPTETEEPDAETPARWRTELIAHGSAISPICRLLNSQLVEVLMASKRRRYRSVVRYTLRTPGSGSVNGMLQNSRERVSTTASMVATLARKVFFAERIAWFREQLCLRCVMASGSRPSARTFRAPLRNRRRR